MHQTTRAFVRFPAHPVLCLSFAALLCMDLKQLHVSLLMIEPWASQLFPWWYLSAPSDRSLGLSFCSQSKFAKEILEARHRQQHCTHARPPVRIFGRYGCSWTIAPWIQLHVSPNSQLTAYQQMADCGLSALLL
ncbi:hypothetical protein Tco_0912495 [Tanacetum coccineum]